jgi:TolA protein
VQVRRRIGNSAWLFWLACGLSVVLHVYFAMALLRFRSEKDGVSAPPTEAISINIETSDILDSPEEAEQSPDSVASQFVEAQEEVKPPEEKPEDAAPPPDPEPEQTVKAEEAQEDTDRKRLEEEERQRLAEEEAQRQAEEAAKQKLAEEALRKAEEEAEQQRVTEEAARRRAEEAERKRVEEAERRREEEDRLAEERRRVRREAEQRDEERRKREQAERVAQEEARKRREARKGQEAAEASQGKQASKGRVSASRGSVLNYGASVRAKIARNTPKHSGSGGAAAKVAFAVSSSGAITFARIVKSSGNSALDQTALSTVRRSSPFPPPPEGATTAQLSFTLNFTFR